MMTMMDKGRSAIAIQTQADGQVVLYCPQEVMTISETLTEDIVEMSYRIQQINHPTSRVPWFIYEFLRLSPATGLLNVERQFREEGAAPTPPSYNTSMNVSNVETGIDMYNRMMPPQYHLESVSTFPIPFIPTVLFRISPDQTRIRDKMGELYKMADLSVNKLGRELLQSGTRYGFVSNQVSGLGYGATVEKFVEQLADGSPYVSISAMGASIQDLVTNLSTNIQTDPIRSSADFIINLINSLEMVPSVPDLQRGVVQVSTSEVTAILTESLMLLENMKI